MSYSFNPSSSPPSTPDRTPQKGSKGFSFGGSNPSTTPAGPPPSSAGSFTPAGPPPSSIFGSSVLGPTSQGKPFSFSKHTPFENSITAPRSALRNEYQSSPPTAQYYLADQSNKEAYQRGIHEEQLDGDEYSEPCTEEGHEQSDVPEEDAMTDDEDANYEVDGDTGDLPSEHLSDFEIARGSNADSLLNSSLRNSEGALMLRGSMGQSYGTRSKETSYGKIAKDSYTQMGIPSLEESDDIILKTESCMERLYAEGIGPVDSEDRLSEALTTTSTELIKLWKAYDERTRGLDSEEYMSRIGPGPQASNFAKANFVAQLALRIYQPGSIGSDGFKYTPKPLPAIMQEWLTAHHDPLPEGLRDIRGPSGNPSHHHLFWNAVLHSLLRGNIKEVITMLKDADWRHASDQSSNNGYAGAALINVQKVMDSAVQILGYCPGLHGDWNIGHSDWTLFRVQAARAQEDLKRFAEGRHRITEEISNSLRQPGIFSQTAREAESRVPWYLYQNLLTLYNLVLGDATAVVANSQDWCEATVGLMLWRNEDKYRDLFTSTRRRSVLLPPEEPTWNRKLQISFERATANPAEIPVNTLDPVQVAIASLFEGNNEAVIGFLRAWSGPISSAMAEIASCGYWLPRAEPQSLIDMDSFDQDDLDVLGISASPSKTDSVKDQTLITYAKTLSRKGLLILSAQTGHETSRHGWELALANLGRLDSAQRSEDVVAEFLKTLPLKNSNIVDRLWKSLTHLGMTQHAQSTAESYADKLAEETHEYGQALWYYSLSHNAQKVKDVLDLLISICLTQSTAYPPESELDSQLKQLTTSPAATLAELSSLDVDAAKLLHKLLSGYATLRHFYFLRDEAILLPKGLKPHAGPHICKNEAADALLAVITSADDNIRGGLYDESRGAIVSVDFILALLAEALVFLDDADFSFSTSQIELLLRSIEDLQGVTSRVYSACNEFLQTVLASASGLKGSTPADMLRKSTSNLSGSSFTLTGSSMLASQLQKSISNNGLGKGIIKRAWDWRKGMNAAVSGEELLRMLRLRLAKALASSWIREADEWGGVLI